MSDSEDERILSSLINGTESTKRVEAEYSAKREASRRKLSDKQLENLKKMRENKLQKSQQRKSKKQEDDYINKILTEKEDVLLERLRSKLKKEGRDVDIVAHDEPVKPRSSIKPPRDFVNPPEPPKAKEPEAPEPPQPQKPVNPFIHLF
jgi:tRNA A37 methylthiotransferase MiaB